MKCFEVKFVDNGGQEHTVGLACEDTSRPHVIRSAWKTLWEGRHVAGTALVDSIRETEGI